MSLLNPFAPFLLTILALVCVALLSKIEKRPLPEHGRFASIDGLRGYLAFFVFIHHAAIWHSYASNGRWVVPDTNLFVQFGQASVSLFFMITSFLFYNKLIDNKNKPFDWSAFFIGRFFRLMPLYLASMIAVFAVVAFLSKGVLHDSVKYTIRCLAQWTAFTVFGAPNINQTDTALIIAGVTWSLPYEWFFYFCLPLLALTTAQRVRWPLVIISVAVLVLGTLLKMELQLAAIFAGGIIASFSVRNERFCKFARSAAASALAIILIC